TSVWTSRVGPTGWKSAGRAGPPKSSRILRSTTSLQFARARVLSARCLSIAEERSSRSLTLFLIQIQILLVLAVPSNAFAQRDSFFPTLVTFYKTLGGTYGDEGPQLVAQLQELSTALERWDDEIRAAEQQLRPQLNGADTQTALQVHTLLASLYMERGRFDEALREFDEDIRIDPRRAAFHRFKGLVQQMQGQRAAAESFRAAWLVDPADPQNAYRLLAVASAQTTAQEKARALETLATVEGDLLNGRRSRAAAL